MAMKISEIFYSIQGEGKLTGTPSVFVRTSGCNLRCTWCDTPYTSWSAEGEEISNGEIVERILLYPANHVVLTGGEPLIAPGVEELTRAIRTAGKHLTIETAATVWKDVVCDLASLSPKLDNSTPVDREGGRFARAHDEQRINLETIRHCMKLGDYQLKFVVDRPEDMIEIDDLLRQIGDVLPQDVFMMPQGVTAAALQAKDPWLVRLCLDRGFRYSPRLHILLFGNKRGT